MAKKGGKRTGAGRPAGSKNKVTPEIKAMAQKHCPEALEMIVQLAQSAENESTRLAAAKELLDRGYGKSRQVVDADLRHGGAIQVEMVRL
jgi:hypothetical protein